MTVTRYSRVLVYRFALRPRWITLHAIVLLVAALFGLAGRWQLDRLDFKRTRNRITNARHRLPERPLEDALSGSRSVLDLPVRAVGRYDMHNEVLLIGRSNKDVPGNHVLTPLVLEDGHAIVVDRGWVPPEADTAPVTQAAPPSGSVNVHGILLASEGHPFAQEGHGRVTQLSRIDTQRIAAQLPYPTYAEYLLLKRQEPAPGRLPVPFTLPAASEGPHLFYAIQWFCFIVIALVGYAAILRREARHQAALIGSRS